MLQDYSDDAATSIWLMRPDGGRARVCVRHGVGMFGLSWSPDSQKIAYVAFSQGDCTRENGSLWEVDVTSGRMRLLLGN